MKNPFDIQAGTVIRGRWHNNSYTIIRKLGRGANGIVYLAEGNRKKVAVKISESNVTITSEVNVLKAFSNAQGLTLGPSLLDVDDWTIGSQQIFFYVMEYIDGTHFLNFIQYKGNEWVPICILQLLSDLSELHKYGWVFGDLKPDNLIVTGPPYKIRCIDVGGTTKNGRAIKEFTEFYDRGFWGLGSRKAEPSYDLFSVAMIMINAYYPSRFPKQSGGIEPLREKIDEKEELKKFKSVLLRALTGRYKDALEMRRDLLQLTSKQIEKNESHQSRSFKQQYSVHPSGGNKRNKGKQRRRKVVETLFILCIISFLYLLYIYEQIM